MGMTFHLYMCSFILPRAVSQKKPGAINSVFFATLSDKSFPKKENRKSGNVQLQLAQSVSPLSGIIPKQNSGHESGFQCRKNVVSSIIV